MVVCVGASIAGCTGLRAPIDAAEPANLVIILTDTLRADRAGTEATGPSAMPVFDRVAMRSFTFVNAYSPTSWTRPAVTSLFTGLYPQRHGVQGRQDRLRDGVPTLAEVLAARGFDTVALTTNPHVTPTWGLTRGFARVIELMPNADRLKHGNDAAVVLDAVRRVAPTLRPPFFLYVHLIDPHAPYDPPGEDLAALGHDPKAASTLARYDGEVHFADRHVGRMLAALDDHGLLAASVVVLTADHGEELYDHGALGHGNTLYEEVVRVPLALQVPTTLLPTGEQDGRRITCPRLATPVSLVDLMPTSLALLGQPAASALDGRDVSPALVCTAMTPEPLFFSLDKERASLAAVRWGEHKLLVDRATGDRRLFALPPEGGELAVDPAEAGAVTTQLAGLLEAFERSAQPGLHLLLVGREGVEELRRVELLVETEGRFTFARGLGLEPTDRVELAGGGTRLWASVALRSVFHRAPKRIWAQDRDELLFDVEPQGAPLPLSLTVKVDGRLGGISTRNVVHNGVWPVRVNRATLAAETALVDRRESGLYLFVREPAAATQVEVISAELAAALAALGYVDRAIDQEHGPDQAR